MVTTAHPEEGRKLEDKLKCFCNKVLPRILVNNEMVRLDDLPDSLDTKKLFNSRPNRC
jgi:excinuclease ABC subunit A